MDLITKFVVLEYGVLGLLLPFGLWAVKNYLNNIQRRLKELEEESEVQKQHLADIERSTALNTQALNNQDKKLDKIENKIDHLIERQAKK